jgi:multidrug efflux pump subunit AcrB
VKFSREVLRMNRELAKSPLVEAVTGGFYTDTPKLRVKVDRAKCELMKVPMSSVYTALQHNLGSIYVNDVNLGTQVNRVTAMSDWCGRARPDDIRKLYVRSKTGAMVPVDTLVTFSEELGPRACYRCDQYLYCTEQFIPKPGVSTSEAVEEVRRICREKLSPGFRNDWAGFTYESLKSRGDEWLLFGLSVLFAYLVMVAYRESWRRAFWTLLPSVAAVFGAMSALWITGVVFSVYSRYAVLMLVATTSAMSLAAGRGAGFKAKALLPILAALTVLPLVFASGAGAAGSRSLGMTLFGGYLSYAFFGVLLSSMFGRFRLERRCES